MQRGRLTEGLHYGAMAVVSGDGELVAALGDPDRPGYPRSSLKPFQELPLVESGAADAFGLATRHLALACASHRAEPFQVTLIDDWLARLGLRDERLGIAIKTADGAPHAHFVMLVETFTRLGLIGHREVERLDDLRHPAVAHSVGVATGRLAATEAWASLRARERAHTLV